MGAYDRSHVITAKNKTAAIQEAKAYQTRQQFEGGHGPYTGHLGTNGIGVNVLAQSFDSVESAREHILSVHDKWSPPMLAHIRGTDTWLLCGLCPS